VAPGLNVLSDDAAKNLTEYVRNGGHLVLGQRSAMKNEDNGLQPERQPGPLADLLGGRVEQYYALLDTVPVEGKFGAGNGKVWAELLSAKAADVEVLERYGKSNGWLDGQPAAITRAVGKGRITYIGGWLDDAGMKDVYKRQGHGRAVDGGAGGRGATRYQHHHRALFFLDRGRRASHTHRISSRRRHPGHHWAGDVLQCRGNSLRKFRAPGHRPINVRRNCNPDLHARNRQPQLFR